MILELAGAAVGGMVVGWITERLAAKPPVKPEYMPCPWPACRYPLPLFGNAVSCENKFQYQKVIAGKNGKKKYIDLGRQEECPCCGKKIEWSEKHGWRRDAPLQNGDVA